MKELEECGVGEGIANAEEKGGGVEMKEGVEGMEGVI